MLKFLNATLLLTLISSCSFYSVVKIKGDGQVGYLRTETCDEYFMGVKIKNREQLGDLLFRKSIDQITMIEEKSYYPLMPFYFESCYVITGNATMTKEERAKFIKLQHERNSDFNKKQIP